MLRAIAASFILAVSSTTPALAASEAEVDALFEAMRIPELMQVLRDEGVSQATDISDTMFPERAAGWAKAVSGIYNPKSLGTTFRKAFGDALANDDISELITFFQSDIGQQIVELELSARVALLDPDAEATAIQAFEDLQDADPDRVAQIEAYVEANDLVELNVMGGLNASLAFYNGLSDGDAFVMSQDEILSTVWAQETQIRDASSEWLFAYLGLAYGPLSDEQLGAYVALSQSSAGADLNRALFSGYDSVFSSVSYNTGAAAALFAMGEDI